MTTKIYDLIDSLQQTSSSNKKKDILLKAFDGDPDAIILRQNFIKFLDYVYNEVDFVYNLKKIPKVHKNHYSEAPAIEDLFQLANQLNNLSGGEEAKKLIVNFLEKA